ncbi:MAG: Hsp20 family protein [Proteobacteria bacterium]|nr:Hsp20 family protein [Pseudomonadota bacterium]MBI3496860.1 Hsp20 family protein [Pseudomonadota bacterium]
MLSFDFSPLFRSTVGFDRLVDLIDSANQADAGSGYPPYNIERTGDDSYRITLAVAGFDAAEVSITAQANSLVIAGKRNDDSGEGSYLHRGIAGRAFERRFQLADHIKVTDASLANGLLKVDLVREVPEAMRPRQIPVQTKLEKASIADKAAA